MVYFDPRRKAKLKTDTGPGGMAATMKRYDRRPSDNDQTHRSRTFTNIETIYSQLEKRPKLWSRVSSPIIQIYLDRMEDGFEVETDHKPLVLLLTGYRTTEPLHIE